MKAYKCDRCKKEIIYSPLQPISFPEVSIIKIYALTDCRQVDLCDKCKEKFFSWIESEVEDEK